MGRGSPPGVPPAMTVEIKKAGRINMNRSNLATLPPVELQGVPFILVSMFRVLGYLIFIYIQVGIYWRLRRGFSVKVD